MYVCVCVAAHVYGGQGTSLVSFLRYICDDDGGCGDVDDKEDEDEEIIISQ